MTDTTSLSNNPLSGCPALAGLSPLALKELFAEAEERQFAPGDVLIRQGDPGDGLLILLGGEAHALLRSRDGDYLLGRFAHHDLVGELALVTREARSADVIADTDVRALFVPVDVFDRLAARHLELGAVLTTLVADRLGQNARDGLGDKAVEGFRILRCIGRGGMSVVYHAQDEVTGEQVALKMMSYRLIYDARALARFRQEAELLQELEHENIARLIRLFPAYHTYFLVMELCEGADIQRIVNRRGPMPEREVRFIVGQLARALEYVHARGLVHRDLKPSNIMVTRAGLVKLMDFGLAAPIVGTDERTVVSDTGIVGTPLFMAPEQLSGGALDNRTDIYALGCLAFELIEARHLFRGGNVFELMQQKLELQLPPREELVGGVSAEMYAFLEAALRAKPDDRLSSLAPLTGWAGPCEPPPEELFVAPHAGSPSTSSAEIPVSNVDTQTATAAGEGLL
jgi:CRP-like cAMP-binding protein